MCITFRKLGLIPMVMGLIHLGYAQSNKIISLEGVNIDATHRNYYKKQSDPTLRLYDNHLDAPQSVTMISSNLLQDQLAYNINESADRSISGAVREQLHNMISPDLYLRGSYATSLRNGVDVRPIIFNGHGTKGPIADDIAIVEGLEFVKGPSSFTTALGDGSGSYNTVFKKPTGEKFQHFDLSYGSWRYFRSAADLSGTLDKHDKLQYRFNIMGLTTKSFTKFVNDNRLLVAPSLKYNFTPNTSIEVLYMYQKLNYKQISNALISPYGYNTVPRDFSINDPAQKPYLAEDHSVYLTFQHKLHNNWQFTLQLANINNYYNGIQTWVYEASKPNTDTLNRVMVYDNMRYNIASLRAYIQGNWRTGSLSHKLLTGIDANRKDFANNDTWETSDANYPLLLSNPRYNYVVPIGRSVPNYENNNDITGQIHNSRSMQQYISAHALYELGLLKNQILISVGGRLTLTNVFVQAYKPESLSGTNLAFTPRVGITYKPHKSLNIYALYDNSFLPRIGVDEQNQPLQPLRAHNLELGIKKEFMDSKWLLGVAVYHVMRNNFIINNPVVEHNPNTNFSKNVAQGVEVDLNGEIVKGLNAVINYAYTDSRITESDNKAEIGLPTPDRVKHIHNLWLTYQLPFRQVQGLQLSFGYRYLVGREERYPSRLEHMRLDDYFVLDAGLGFVRNKWSIRGIVNNLTDVNYAPTGWNKDGLYYWVQGAPLNFRITLSVKI